ncbi:MAG: hypothetical protein IPJ46_24745 [Anaerolineales bacterium]|nr:hypothetical protein [Anaerolineales bacterium]
MNFSKAVDGKGWAAINFLEVENLDSVPVIGTAEETIEASPTTEIAVQLAMQDGDSMQAPLTETVFSLTGTQILQVSGALCAAGKYKDWIKFTPFKAKNICADTLHKRKISCRITEKRPDCRGYCAYLRWQAIMKRRESASLFTPSGNQQYCSIYIQYTLKISMLE